MSPNTLLIRFTAPGPKRMLALDGGGIRGLVALEYLRRIETLLREQHGSPNLRLCDYFDLIGGTSTGSLIACGLALGWTVDDLIKRYEELGRAIFRRRFWKSWESFYHSKGLEEILRETLGDKTLGDDSLKTGLCIFCRRLDTGSVWKFVNHPHAKFFGDNSGIRLADLVRASTAAPTVFKPHSFTVSNTLTELVERGTFIDGSVGTTHDPSLHLLWVATLKGFPFQWKPGASNLLLVSVGTGHWAVDEEFVAKPWHSLLGWASNVPRLLISEASTYTQTVMQWISESPTAHDIDREMGDLQGDTPSQLPLLHYVRYSPLLNRKGFAEINQSTDTATLRKLRSLVDASNVEPLRKYGRHFAEQHVSMGHFSSDFRRVIA